jgi:hypothetical protein
MLAGAVLLTVLDSLASEVTQLEDVFGIDGTDPNTIAGKASAARDLLAALDDATVQRDVTIVFARRPPLVIASSLYPSLQGLMIARALDAHYGGNGSLNRFLTDNDLRVSPNLRKIGIQIDSRNVFRDTALDPVARYEGEGAGTGTFIAGSDIDTSLYGEAALEVVVEAMGAVARTLRLSLKNFDGTIELRDVAIPGNAALNAAFPVGAANDRFVGVTNIITTGGGGTAADLFRVRSKVERGI